MADDLSTTLKDLLVEFLRPLDEAARNPRVLVDLLAALGHTSAISGNPAVVQIAQHAQAVSGKLQALDAQTLQSTAGLVSLLSTGREVAAILQELRTFAADPARNQFAASLPEELMSFLLASYLRRKQPTAFRIASLLTLIDARETAAMDPPIAGDGTTLRYARVLDRFRFAAVSSLVQQPGATLKSFYFPNDLANGADAWLGAQRLFPNLAFVADAVGLSWRSGSRPIVPPPAPPDPDPNAPIPDGEVHPGDEDPPLPESTDQGPLPAPLPPVPDEYHATNYPLFRLRLAGDEATGLALELLSSSAKHPGNVAGVIMALAGDVNRTETSDQWKLTFSASGAIPALSVGPGGLARVAADHVLTNGTAKFLIERVPDANAPGPAFLFGTPQGTRLEIGSLKLSADLSFDPNTWSASIALNAGSGALVLAPGDGDGFLSSVLPSDGTRAEFDLGLAWSNASGFSLRGGAGLAATLPVNRSFAGVTLSSVYVGLLAQADRLVAETSLTGSLAIGPVKAVVDRIGLSTVVAFPPDGGNLGVADLDFGFKPPSGIGLSIDTHGVVSGGGTLIRDPVQGLYAGVMQLSISDAFTVTAFGLIATKMPDGSPGYSLIVFITAEDFRPIPLGMGFTLQGIGGMIAVNRTFDQDVLRAGMQNDTLKSLLFPRDPVTNAPTIIRSLASAFPARRGSYLLGILARIGWFTPTLILLDLALILEFGARKRLLVLGRISALLPSPDNDLVRINLDAIGVLDFDQDTASIDAMLVDSRLAKKFVLTGAAALRAGWGSGPHDAFVLAVGGFNPHFAPPAGVPPLARVAIALSSGNNPRLTCEAYFALTANTIQFGANAALYAEACSFSIEGDIGFDVLITRAPLHFIADYHASVQLKYESHNLFKVSVEGSLEGPRPLRVSGKATFEIFWCDFSVRFDKKLIDGDPPPPPPAVDVLAELNRALSTAQSWSTQAPANATQGVALRKLAPGTALVLDPLGRLAIKQDVVPLNSGRDIDVFGGAPVAGARRFALAAAVNNIDLTQVTPLQAPFAPAQFFAMSDDDKIASPSFVPMDAGFVVGANDAVTIDPDPAQLAPAPLEYDSIVIDTLAGAVPPKQPAPYVLPAAQLAVHALTGAAARAPVRRVGRARFRTPGAPAVDLAAPAWAIAPLDGGPAVALAANIKTYTEYQGALTTLNRAGARFQLVPAADLAA